MSMRGELRDAEDAAVRGVPDPSGGTFDAAGDFDRVIANDHLPVLGAIDPYSETRLDRSHMAAVLQDLALALAEATPGPETRGLDRLRVLAQFLADGTGSQLVFVGD